VDSRTARTIAGLSGNRPPCRRNSSASSWVHSWEALISTAHTAQQRGMTRISILRPQPLPTRQRTCASVRLGSGSYRWHGAADSFHQQAMNGCPSWLEGCCAGQHRGTTCHAKTAAAKGFSVVRAGGRSHHPHKCTALDSLGESKGACGRVLVALATACPWHFTGAGWTGAGAGPGAAACTAPEDVPSFPRSRFSSPRIVWWVCSQPWRWKREGMAGEHGEICRARSARWGRGGGGGRRNTQVTVLETIDHLHTAHT
jgi:hypothetical protein